MSEEDHADDAAPTENQSTLNRRRFVKSLGAAGSAAMVGSMGTVSAFGHKQSSAPDIQMLEGAEKRKVADAIRGTTEYSQLVREAERNGNPVKDSSNPSRVGRMTANGRTREIVEFELSNVEQGSGYILIGRDLDTNEVSVSELEYDYVARDGTPATVVRYELESSNGFSTQTVGGSFEKETYEIEDKVREIGNSLKNDDTETSSGGSFTTQGLGDGPCDECKLLAGQVCTIACNGAGGFVCGFAGLLSGGIGGVGCLTIVKAICYFASFYSCSDTKLGQKACARVNLC